MDEQRAFLRAIAEAGGDDTPRLAYADWIQEHGDEKLAVLIRRCIEYPGSFCVIGGKSRGGKWGIRAFNGGQHVFKGHMDLARKFLPDPSENDNSLVVFHRGFPCEFTVPVPWWDRHAETILERGPRPNVRLFPSGEGYYVGPRLYSSVHRFLTFASVNGDTQFDVAVLGTEKKIRVDKKSGVSALEILQMFWPGANFIE